MKKRIDVATRRWITALSVLALSLLCPVRGEAQSRGTGVGIIVGEPSALLVKHWTSARVAWQVTAGWAVRRYREDVFVAGDILWHDTAVLSSGVDLPLYYGVGVYATHSAGVRGTIGLGFGLRGVPMDVFVQLNPAFALGPATELIFQGGFGVRWFFE